tara:strand:+ start:453 stop:803 length:351 start_codon:yes stop_codon:yes gene_type:complete
MERAEFGTKLRQHDWYYGYSDDHRVWTRGRNQMQVLRTAHEDLECPFDMKLLEKWAHKMIVENFKEEEPGKWYPNPRKYSCIAPTPREGLITQAQHDEVTQWMALGATAEEIAKIA